MHIGLLPQIHAARFPRKVAARDPWGAVTYGELERRTNRLAQALVARGVRKGDPVGIVLGNRVEHLEVSFAVAKAGGVGVPLDPTWTEGELSRAAKFFGIGFFFVEEAAADRLARGIAEVGLGPVELAVVGDSPQGPFLRYEDLVKKGEDATLRIPVFEQDPFMILMTSGTTGTPKGCLVSHGSYLFRCLSYAVEFQMGPEDREVLAVPLCLGAGRGSTFAILALGGSVILEPKFDPKRFLSLITQEKITTFSLVPTTYQSLVNALGPEGFDGRTLLSMKTVGSPMPMSLRHEVRKKISGNLFQTYASVETGVMAVLRPGEMEEELTLVGRPIWGMEVKIVGERGQELGAGEVGEISCRGPLVSQGYFRNPEATSAAFRGDWFRTGDLGSLDEKGRLYVRGRKKNLIKSGGRSVFPDEVEAVLQSHPRVQEAGVFGVADPKWGEAVHAAVVPKPGETLSPEDLLEFCRRQLAGYKCPKQIHVMRELPRGNLGKVSIEVLKKEIDAVP